LAWPSDSLGASGPILPAPSGARALAIPGVVPMIAFEATRRLAVFATIG